MYLKNLKAETDRASTPPTFKRTNSSPEIEPLDSFETIYKQQKEVSHVFVDSGILNNNDFILKISHLYNCFILSRLRFY